MYPHYPVKNWFVYLQLPQNAFSHPALLLGHCLCWIFVWFFTAKFEPCEGMKMLGGNSVFQSLTHFLMPVFGSCFPLNLQLLDSDAWSRNVQSSLRWRSWTSRRNLQRGEQTWKDKSKANYAIFHIPEMDSLIRAICRTRAFTQSRHNLMQEVASNHILIHRCIARRLWEWQ